MRIHSGMLMNSSGKENNSPHRAEIRFPKQDVRIKSSETYNKICGNLLYSLERMKLNSEKEAYIELVDSVVIGPANLHASDVENILGVNMEIFNHSKRKRKPDD